MFIKTSPVASRPGLAEVLRHADAVRERCRLQRIAMLCEREALRHGEIMRHYYARRQMRRHFSAEVNRAVRALVESVDE